MFKAWNKESRLMMRLDSISCVRGELTKPDHVLLQFTGQRDRNDEDLYDMDVVFIGTGKYVIHWSAEKAGWVYSPLGGGGGGEEALTAVCTARMQRLCSYLESSGERLTF